MSSYPIFYRRRSRQWTWLSTARYNTNLRTPRSVQTPPSPPWPNSDPSRVAAALSSALVRCVFDSCSYMRVTKICFMKILKILLKKAKTKVSMAGKGSQIGNADSPSIWSHLLFPWVLYICLAVWYSTAIVTVHQFFHFTLFDTHMYSENLLHAV